MIERKMKSVEILLAAGEDARDQLLGRHAFRFSLEHDGRAMRVVRAHPVHLVPQHALKAHPDVGLDVLHDVADVKRPVRVRQRGRDEEAAGRFRSWWRIRCKWHANYAMGPVDGRG